MYDVLVQGSVALPYDVQYKVHRTYCMYICTIMVLLCTMYMYDVQGSATLYEYIVHSTSYKYLVPRTTYTVALHRTCIYIYT